MRNICTEHSSHEQPLSHTVPRGNKYHTRGGISDTVYATSIQLYKLVTPTYASEFKITPLFLTPRLLTLPLRSIFLTAPFSANNPFKSIPLLLQLSLGELPSPEALPLQFGGATKPLLNFTGTFGEGTGQTTPFLTTLPPTIRQPGS